MIYNHSTKRVDTFDNVMWIASRNWEASNDMQQVLKNASNSSSDDKKVADGTLIVVEGGTAEIVSMVDKEQQRLF